ncbi:MAG TPA: glycosyltransferase [Flavobacteriales bacterium]
MSSLPVSILLPFLDAETTLRAAIDSIVAQRFSAWELFLIDNASTDGSTLIAHEQARRDVRIRVLDEPRKGIAFALNTGLAEAQGRYIARMDADDIAHPERLQQQVEYLEAHPEIGVLGTATRFTSTMNESRGMQAFVQWQNELLTPHQHYVKRFVDAPLAHPTVLFRRELVERHGGYDTGPVPEDHELWLRWMHAGVRFAKLPEPLLTWTDHPQRLSRTHANYSAEAFFTTKTKWIAAWIQRKYAGSRPVIIAGTSALCQERARLLTEHGVPIQAFTDVSGKAVPGRAFIPHTELPGAGQAMVVSFISQRGTGGRIAAFLSSRGLVEGEDFILAA